MRSATLTVALMTGAVVLWMVTFTARPDGLHGRSFKAASVAEAQIGGGTRWNRP
jgi:hypothetical protein